MWSPQCHQNHREWKESQVGISTSPHETLQNPGELCREMSKMFYFDMQEELDLLVDCAAGILPALCKGSGGQHQLGTYPISPERLVFFFSHSIHLRVVSLFLISAVICLHCHMCCEVCHPLFIAFLPLLSSSPPS